LTRIPYPVGTDSGAIRPSHSTEGWEEVLLPEIERQQGRGEQVVFPGDAGFAKPEISASFRPLYPARRLQMDWRSRSGLHQSLLQTRERPVLGRTAGEACGVLLALLGGGASESTAVPSDAWTSGVARTHSCRSRILALARSYDHLHDLPKEMWA